MDVKKRSETAELTDGEVSFAAEAERDKSASFWGSAAKGLLYALMGYCLGGAALPYGAKPLGLAILCASDRQVLYLYAGLCLGAWGGGARGVWLIAYSAVLLLRLLSGILLEGAYRRSREGNALFFSEHLSLRAASAAVGAFGVGLYFLIQGHFLFYDLYGTILGTVTAPVAVLLLSGLYAHPGHRRSALRRRVGEVTLCVALVLSLGNWSPWGISAAVFLGATATFYLVKREGLATGLVGSLLCGLVCDPLLAPAFVFAALSMGLLQPISLSLGAGAAFLSAVAWSGYVRGLGILSGILPGWIAACLLFPVLTRMRSEEHRETVTEEPGACLPLPADAEQGVLFSDLNRRLRRTGAGLSTLAQVLEQLSAQTEPGELDWKQVCEQAFSSSCTSCSLREDCRERGFTRTEREIDVLCSALHRQGRITGSDVPEEMAMRCARLPDILEELNQRATEHRRQRLMEDRSESFALDWGAFSDLLETLCSAGEQRPQRDEVLTEALCRRLSEDDPKVVGAAVLKNGTGKQILLKGREGTFLSGETADLRRAISESCGVEVDGGALDETLPGMIFRELPHLRVSWAVRTARAEGEEEFCGDTAGIFFDGEGLLYGLISDGMGSGREAAQTSGIAGLFLRKLLETGCPGESALNTLNGFLRSRGGGSLHECSATVDLLALDLMEGEAQFYKSGAAPTYVFRDGGLFKLRSRTVPLGILRETDVRRIRLGISPGDVIVMVSDGVTQLREECPWLFDLVRGQMGGKDREINPDRLADLIVKYAKEEGSTDDLSVLVLRIEARQ